MNKFLILKQKYIIDAELSGNIDGSTVKKKGLDKDMMRILSQMTIEIR